MTKHKEPRATEGSALASARLVGDLVNNIVRALYLQMAIQQALDSQETGDVDSLVDQLSEWRTTRTDIGEQLGRQLDRLRGVFFAFERSTVEQVIDRLPTQAAGKNRWSLDLANVLGRQDVPVRHLLQSSDDHLARAFPHGLHQLWKLYYEKGLTQRACGEILGLSQASVSGRLRDLQAAVKELSVALLVYQQAQEMGFEVILDRGEIGRWEPKASSQTQWSRMLDRGDIERWERKASSQTRWSHMIIRAGVVPVAVESRFEAGLPPKQPDASGQHGVELIVGDYGWTENMLWDQDAVDQAFLLAPAYGGPVSDPDTGNPGVRALAIFWQDAAQLGFYDQFDLGLADLDEQGVPIGIPYLEPFLEQLSKPPRSLRTYLAESAPATSSGGEETT